MAFSLYDSAITLAQHALNSLSHIIKQAEAAPNAASLPEARIISDMRPLTFQVHFVTDTCSKMVARLSGSEPAAFDHNGIETYADMHARIAQVQEIVSRADKELINSRQDEVVNLGLGPGKNVQVGAVGYVNGYALPNIFFHLVTAYDILRKEGVPLGKVEYMTAFLTPYSPQGL